MSQTLKRLFLFTFPFLSFFPKKIQTILNLSFKKNNKNKNRKGEKVWWIQCRACLPPNSTREIIEICPTPLYLEINTVYNVYMYMVLLTVLPFALLALLNAFIVYRVNKRPGRQGDEEGMDRSFQLIIFK